LLGDGTVDDAGTYDTQGDENRGSVVARAISSLELGSGVSGATVNNTGAPGMATEGGAAAAASLNEAAVPASEALVRLVPPYAAIR
jgi:hypothetical protein